MKLPVEVVVKPSPILIKLLYAIVVKQCILAPEDSEFLTKHCHEPDVLETLGNLFEFNQKLIELTLPYTPLMHNQTYRQWNFKELRIVLKQYVNYLITLGFTLEESSELFPYDMPMPRMLSLKEQAFIMHLQHKAGTKLNLPNDILENLKDKDYIESLMEQYHINQEFITGIIPRVLKDIYSGFVRFKEFNGSNNPEEKQEILTFLLDMLSIPETKWPTIFTSTKSSSILHIVAAYGPSYFLKFLIEKYQDESFINTTNKAGQTALHWAAFHHNLSSVELLVTAGARLNIQDNSGGSALHLANCTRIYPRTVLNAKKIDECDAVTEYLLKQGINSELVDKEGLTAYETYLTLYFTGHQPKAFENYYNKLSSNGDFLYTEQLNQENALDLLQTALKESRGIIFFREFARKYPEQILSYRDAQGNDIVQVIWASRRDYRKQSINNKLLKTISDNFSQLYQQKNAEGKTNFAVIMRNFNSDEFYRENPIFYQNSSYLRRDGLLGFIFLNLAIYSFVIIASIFVALSKSFEERKGLFTAFSLIILSMIPLSVLYAVVPPYFWSCLRDLTISIALTLVKAPISLIKLFHSPKIEHELQEIVIEGESIKQNNDERTSLLLPCHPHPAGIKLVRPQPQARNNLQSTVEALIQYLKTTKDNSEDVNDALITENLLDGLQMFVKNVKTFDDSLALDICDYLKEQLSLPENRSLSENIIIRLQEYSEGIRTFCAVEPIVLEKKYGTFSISQISPAL